ncbi:MAG: hypothetical protein FIB07_17070 [Candidatus Methanoperedens sp.]|nr:hypothetical protein [Candidatus Methanoperedens sp.]
MSKRINANPAPGSGKIKAQDTGKHYPRTCSQDIELACENKKVAQDTMNRFGNELIRRLTCLQKI